MDASRFLWGVANKSTGWTAPAVGKPGPVRHASGHCIDAAPSGQGGAAVLKACSPGSRTQQFVLESNGNLHAQVSSIM